MNTCVWCGSRAKQHTAGTSMPPTAALHVACTPESTAIWICASPTSSSDEGSAPKSWHSISTCCTAKSRTR
jgi:hypothetical protein